MARRETKAMQRARQVLASKQAAWDSTWKRIDTAKEATMAKRIHFLLDDGDETACGFEYADDEQVSDDLDDVTCKKCIKAAEELEALEAEEELEDLAKNDEEEDRAVHYTLFPDMTACEQAITADVSSSLNIAQVTCEPCRAMQAAIEEGLQEAKVPMHLKAIFTLAPRTLDKGDTKEFPGKFLYQGTTPQGLNQPLRRVLIPQAHMDRQIDAYIHPIPYLTFHEYTIAKYLKQGTVTEAPVSADVLETQEQMILNTIAPEKEKAMSRTKIDKLPARTARVEVLRAKNAPKPQATITEVVHANMPAPSALDAILTTPIAHSMPQAPVGVPDEFLTRLDAPKRPLALPAERSEEELVQGLNPGFAMQADMYKAFVQAFRQALKEEGLVIVPEVALQHGCGEDSAPVPEPEIWGSILDVPRMPAPVAPPVWGSELDAPVKPKSTLQVFTSGKQSATKTPKAPGKKAGGKTDPAVVKAIQKAWASGNVTQAALAEKYNMDDKKVWYLCNRAPKFA